MSSIRNIAIACCMTFSLAAGAQDIGKVDWRDIHDNSFSVYGLAGASFARVGENIQSVNAAPFMNVGQTAGLGVSYNATPWLRLGLGYDLSKIRREQRLDQVNADGLFYSKWSAFCHEGEFDIDFNVLDMWPERAWNRLNLYLGTGVGMAWCKGMNYSITGGYQEITEEYKYTMHAWLDGHNERVKGRSPYIPANVCLEYDVTPQLSLGVKAAAQMVLNNTDVLPERIGMVAATVRYNFKGAKYSKNRQIARYRRQYAEDQRTIAELEEKLKNMKLGARDTLEIHVDKVFPVKVFFRFDSDVLDPSELQKIEEIAQVIKDINYKVTVVGHTDISGSDSYNNNLSERRARAVLKALEEYGVSYKNIVYVKGEGKKGMNADASSRNVTIDL